MFFTLGPHFYKFKERNTFIYLFIYYYAQMKILQENQIKENVKCNIILTVCYFNRVGKSNFWK